jgi:hypothetical protein
VKWITLLLCAARLSLRMIFIAAIVRLSPRPEPPPNDLLAQTRLRLGHLGFVIITLVFVLVTLWQR